MNAFLLNLGLETLALRMERHCSNALKVAQYLEADDPRRPGCNYPGLEGKPQPCPGAKIHAPRHLRRGVLRRKGRPGSCHQASWTA